MPPCIPGNQQKKEKINDYTTDDQNRRHKRNSSKCRGFKVSVQTLVYIALICLKPYKNVFLQMNFSSKLLEEAVHEFSSLPGIGNKTALRLVLYLLKQENDAVRRFGSTLTR